MNEVFIKRQTDVDILSVTDIQGGKVQLPGKVHLRESNKGEDYDWLI